MARRTGAARQVAAEVEGLGLQARPVLGESTGSFVHRLAAFDGWEVGELLAKLGAGTGVVAPREAELYLNEAAVDRLAVLTDRPVEVLRRVLPSVNVPLARVGAPELLRADGVPRWAWPWRPQGFRVRACGLCLARHNIGEEVWLAAPDPWQVCVRHRRWLDSTHFPQRPFLSLAGLPEVLTAEKRRWRRERRWGLLARVLLADALQVGVYWWTKRAGGVPAWEWRAQLVGLRANDVRVAPLVLLPEAQALADHMLVWERWRMGGGAEAVDGQWWLEGAEELAGAWRLRCPAWRAPLLRWLGEHYPLPVGAGSCGVGGGPGAAAVRRQALREPHRGAVALQPLQELSCLPWRLGCSVRALRCG
ncbi:TniQ family protein [Streptomyces ochraceiscleroticus]|uniref:TniQ family protein n=1 Tax=Streptomyces ochraceiscleroticus TaxID=47761 RepID=A0ABW1MLN2_9ACTN|nr:TniQ family protein [Streptomyces ochraceiscleroticus]